MKNPAAAAKPLHIFKPGRWTTMAGETIEFSEADLRATAAAFSPSVSKAPIVIGHPATDDPAQGWVASLQATARGLFAVPIQVSPAFAEEANAGRYGALSAKFYRPTDSNNPVPGIWYLRHVGVLGAQNPAVKGLDDPAFASADDDGCVCFQESVAFSGWDDTTVARLLRNMREWMIGRFGQDEANKVLPAYDVSDLEQFAQAEVTKLLDGPGGIHSTAFSEPTPLTEITVTPAEKAALEAENTTLKAKLAQVVANEAAALAEKTHAANVAFCEGLASQARMLPASQAVAVAMLDHLAGQAAAVEFGEGDAKTSLLEGFKGYLSSQPAQVTFGESATNGRAALAGAPDVEYAEGSDPERVATDKKIRAHMAAHKTDYKTAAHAVIR
ncbi:MAG: hypothetical protein I8H71_11335 [Xanthomonadaceae bacterium]|nr:hypothetical protein [Xanthomonadaceae bacterium]